MIAYAKSMDPNKYSGVPPSLTSAPNDMYYIIAGYASKLNP